MKALSKIPLILLCLAMFMVSCDKEEDFIEPEKSYKLAEVRWTLAEGDGEETFTVEVPEKQYSNESAQDMLISFNPLDEIPGKSEFFTSNPTLFSQLNQQEDSISIPTMTEILSDGYGYLSGGPQVPFQLGEYTFDLNTSIQNSTELTPHTKMTYSAKVYLKKITASYIARFVEEGTHNYQEIEGKWTGTFFKSIDSNTVWEEIK